VNLETTKSAKFMFRKYESQPLKHSPMKKLSFLTIAVFIISVSSIRAQGFHLGIKAGTNISQLTGRSFDEGFQWNFMAGAYAELNFSSHWGIQPELLFSQTSTQTASNFNDVYEQGINSRNVKLNYLSIPILLTYKLPLPILSLQAGPQFGILLNTSDNITTNAGNAFKSGNFSMVVGAEVNLGSFKGGARYVYGFTNVADISSIESVDSWKTRTVQLYVGLRIF
jgi:Outer membrane protein beta-barrel domain